MSKRNKKGKSNGIFVPTNFDIVIYTDENCKILGEITNKDYKSADGRFTKNCLNIIVNKAIKYYYDNLYKKENKDE